MRQSTCIHKKHFTVKLIIFIILLCSQNKLLASSNNFAKEIEEIIEIVKSSYIEDITEEQLLKGAVNGILETLDEYSSYFTKESYEKLLIKANGQLFGLGLELVIDKDKKLIVKKVINGSNALLAGIEELSEILYINNKAVAEFESADDIKNTLKAKKIQLTLRKKDSQDQVNITIKSSDIKIATTNSYMVDRNIGYLKISSFSGQTTQNVKEAISQLKKKSAQGIIVDLRNNSGGLLEQAIATANLFLDSGTITIVKDKNKSLIKEIISNGRKKIFDGSIVVIVNKSTASASEILASALQDNNKALIIGETTMGKGRIQNIFPLKNGSAIKLTTTSFHSPKNREIHGFGIKPNIEIYSEVNSEQAIKIAQGILKTLLKEN